VIVLENGKTITALIAVMFGVFSLIIFVGIVDLVVGLLSLTFGIVAIIYAVRAKLSLSKGTELRDYASYYLSALISIVIFSIWDTMIFIFKWTGFLVYPKYFFLTFSYLVFVFTSYKIMRLGKQFGFKEQVKKMDFKEDVKKRAVKTKKAKVIEEINKES